MAIKMERERGDEKVMRTSILRLIRGVRKVVMIVCLMCLIIFCFSQPQIVLEKLV